MAVKESNAIEKVNYLYQWVSENNIAVLLVALGVAARFLPHPANFAPIGAIALFSGTYLVKRYMIALPLAIMVVTDFFLGLHNVILFTWGSFIAIALIGYWLRERKNVLNITVATLCGSFLFFFVTNFGVWLMTPLYAKNLHGLVECYIMAVPFFRNTIAGDIVFTGVLFGAYEAAKLMLSKRGILRSAEK